MTPAPSLPGSFPASSSGATYAEGSSHMRAATGASQACALTDGFLTSPSKADKAVGQFASREAAVARALAHRNLLHQLSSLSTFLIAYQFVRYYRWSCVVPLALHVAAQLQVAMGRGDNGGLFARALAAQQAAARSAGVAFERARVADGGMRLVWLLLHWKLVAAVAWHVVYVMAWLQPQAAAGLERLVTTHGYFFLLMGETQHDAASYDAASPWWLRLWHLRLVGAVALDVGILLVQLVQFQCVYLQSAESPRGIAVGEREIYVVRTRAGPGVAPVPVPDVLHVRLYQALDPRRSWGWGEGSTST